MLQYLRLLMCGLSNVLNLDRKKLEWLLRIYQVNSSFFFRRISCIAAEKARKQNGGELFFVLVSFLSNCSRSLTPLTTAVQILSFFLEFR